MLAYPFSAARTASSRFGPALGRWSGCGRGLATVSRDDGQDGKKMRMILLGAPVRTVASRHTEPAHSSSARCVQGAGKGTLSDWLLERYEIDTIVVGQLLRNEITRGTRLGQVAERTMKQGGALAPRAVAFDSFIDPNFHVQRCCKTSSSSRSCSRRLRQRRTRSVDSSPHSASLR